jgi:hypothetical protein
MRGAGRLGDVALQPARAAYQALRGFVVFFAYIDDATRTLTGFPGPWPERSLPVLPVDYGEIA